MTHDDLLTLKRGDPVEYSGPYVNMRGGGKFLTWEREDRGHLWAVCKINGAIGRVSPDALRAVPAGTVDQAALVAFVDHYKTLRAAELDAQQHAAELHAAQLVAHNARHDAQRIALRVAAPLRPLDRTAAPVDGLPLFDGDRAPTLF